MLNKFPVKDIWDFILKQETITICTHVDPDGDTIGSSVALRELILENTNVKEVKISGGDIPEQFNFISSDISDKVSDDFFKNSQVIIVDTSNKKRVWDKRVITKESIKIDHHKDQEEWLMKIGGDHWPACGEVIGQMATMLNLKVSDKAAMGIVAAIVTDTEHFTQRNMTSNTFKVMSEIIKDFDYLKAVKNLLPSSSDATKINNFLNEVQYLDNTTLLFVDKVIPASLYRALVARVSSVSDKEVTIVIGLDPCGKNYRCGLRSKGNVDVSKIAEALGGGGHFTSSGIKFEKSIGKKEIINRIKKHL